MYLVIKRMSYCAKKRQNQNQIHIFLFLKKIYYTIQSKKKEREKFSIIFWGECSGYDDAHSLTVATRDFPNIYKNT